MQVLRFQHSHSTELLQPPGTPYLLVLSLRGKGHHEGWHMRAQDVQCGVVSALTDRSCCSPQPGSQIWDNSPKHKSLLSFGSSAQRLPGRCREKRASDDLHLHTRSGP